MRFNTPIFPTSPLRITHADKVMFLGSCFAQNISAKALYYGFDVCHPFGAIYNPASVLSSIKTITDGIMVTEDELIEERGLYCCYRFHSSYSDANKAEALRKMNSEIERSREFFNKASYIIITFGTARTYRLISSGSVVSNCHHTDQSCFKRENLSIAEIKDMFIELAQKYSEKEFIFTVSPIRYLKYGLHESRLDKATLLLATDEICKAATNCSYFPSYEIMNDDLRDYRFFNSDMIHPSDVAIDYIWEKFAECYFSKETESLCTKYEKLRKLENHRPSAPGSEEDIARLKKITETRKTLNISD